MVSRIFILLFALNFAILQEAVSQKLIKKMAAEVCDCLNGLGDFLGDQEPTVILGKCFGPVAAKYEKEIRKEYGDEVFESPDNKELYDLGVEVGKVLVTECPQYLDMFINKEKKANSKAEEFHTKAEELNDDGDYDGAITNYNQAIANDPANHEYFNDRGLAYYSKEDYYAAISDFLAAVRLKPEYKTGYYNMAYSKYQLDDLKNALADVQKVIDIDSMYCDAWYLKGLVYNQNRNYEKSLPAFIKAVECNSSDPVYIFEAGYASYKLGNYNEALGFFLDAEEKNYDDADIYSYLGNCYDLLDEYEKAIENHTKYIAGYADDYLGYYNRGLAFYNAEKYQEAIKDFYLALEMDSTDSDIFYKLGQTNDKMGNSVQAFTNLNKAIQLDSDNAGYYDARAKAYANAGEFGRAIEDSKISLVLYPDDCKIYMLMSEWYGKLSNVKLAEDAMKTALDLGCKKD